MPLLNGAIFQSVVFHNFNFNNVYNVFLFTVHIVCRIVALYFSLFFRSFSFLFFSFPVLIPFGELDTFQESYLYQAIHCWCVAND